MRMEIRLVGPARTTMRRGHEGLQYRSKSSRDPRNLDLLQEAHAELSRVRRHLASLQQAVRLEHSSRSQATLAQLGNLAPRHSHMPSSDGRRCHQIGRASHPTGSGDSSKTPTSSGPRCPTQSHSADKSPTCRRPAPTSSTPSSNCSVYEPAASVSFSGGFSRRGQRRRRIARPRVRLRISSGLNGARGKMRQGREWRLLYRLRMPEERPLR